jgi:hypothetical protein
MRRLGAPAPERNTRNVVVRERERLTTQAWV